MQIIENMILDRLSNYLPTFGITLSVIALAALSACGQPPKLELNEFRTYVKAFEDASLQFGEPVKANNLVIRYGSPDELKKLSGKENAIGYCIAGSTPTVVVNEDWWKNKIVKRSKDVEADRQSLIFHELGHCLLARKHKDEMVEGYDLPISIMHKTHLEGLQFKEYRDHYLSELFNQKT